MSDDKTQSDGKNPAPAPPPYEPDDELIGFIERGQRPLGKRTVRASTD